MPTPPKASPSIERGEIAKAMPRGTKIMLSFADWPAEDQERWQRH